MNMIFDKKMFLSRSGTALGTYVDEVNQSNAVLSSLDTLRELLSQLNELEIEHAIYALIWGVEHNATNKIVDQVIDYLKKDYLPPGGAMTLLNLLNGNPRSVTKQHCQQLMHMQTGVPTHVWQKSVFALEKQISSKA